jgi:predicted ATP-grasp superfamily ATP-dependent carboligase
MAMSERVLIGFADALAAIESAWSLADHGFEVHAFARSGSTPALRHCTAVRIFDITPPEQDALRSAEDLARAVTALDPLAVLPLDDHAVWLSSRAVQQVGADPDGCAFPSGSVLAGPSGQLADLALDKRRQLEAATLAGFAVPPSADAAGRELPGPGPWMVKPAMAVSLSAGQLRRGTGRIATTAGAAQAVTAAIGGPAIAQPLIEGTGEGVFGLATTDGVTALSAHRRIRMMNPRGSGSSACRSVPVDETLAGVARDFVSKTGWRGLFMIELLRDDRGTPWFMELNGRTWGSMALASRRGFAYPAWAVQAALGRPLPPQPPSETPHLTARHLGREIVHLGAVLAYGGAPRLRTVRDVLTLRRGDCWYNWRRGNAAVFAADTWSTLRSQAGR